MVEAFPSRVTLQQLNRMNKQEFTQSLGGIFEHSPWVTEAAWEDRPFRTVPELHQVMMKVVVNAGEKNTLALLRAHPDLATRLQVSPLSKAEQQGAGLDRLTPEQFLLLGDLNRRYTAKFNFPFILAVRGRTVEDIITSLKERLSCSLEAEQERAIAEIARITWFRVEEAVAEVKGRLTTHVLDLTRGTPAAGLFIELFRQEQGVWNKSCEATTNLDGRVDEPLLEGEHLLEGDYELLFHAGEYFRRADSGPFKMPQTEAGTGIGETFGRSMQPLDFFNIIPVRFRIQASERNYHVPLLLAPGGYSTYRGS